MKEYGAKVRTWWRYNQPLWRYEDCDEDWPLVRHAPPLEDWKEVAKGGANGLLMVMVALGWWFENVGDKTDVAELSSVIEDVRWVLHEIKTGIEEGPVLDMLVARGGTTKHGREESDDKGKERKQKKRYAHTHNISARHPLTIISDTLVASDGLRWQRLTGGGARTGVWRRVKSNERQVECRSYLKYICFRR